MSARSQFPIGTRVVVRATGRKGEVLSITMGDKETKNHAVDMDDRNDGELESYSELELDII